MTGQRRPAARLLCLGLLSLVLHGCGSGRSLYPVSGWVEFSDGKRAVELAGGAVEFEAEDGSVSARATIQDDGSYRLGTYKNGDGAVAGMHRVVVVDPPPKDNWDRPPPPVVDERYRHFDTSGLNILVEPKSNHIPIKVDRFVKPR